MRHPGKQLITAILSVALLLGLLPMQATRVVAETSTVSDNDFECVEKSDGTLEITGYSGKATELKIPKKIDNKKVTSIGSRAFSENKTLTAVTIPEGFTAIGPGAFYCAEKLSYITIANTVKKIGNNAFSGTAFAKDEINWENKVLYIGDHLIKADTTLSGKYVVREGTVFIADGAFESCSGLTKVTIPDSVKYIGSAVFAESGVYKNSKNWKSGLLYAGKFLVAAKKNSGGKYTVKKGTIGICGEAFSGLTKVKSVTIPDSVEYIGNQAFSNCMSLKSVLLPAALTEIDSYAFFGCQKLEEITIPKSVSYIGVGAFDCCYKLATIKVEKGNKKYIADNNILYDKRKTKLLQYAIGKKDTKLDIPATVITIFPYSVKEASNLTRVTIPKSVREIGDCAFEDCIKLNNVKIPMGVTTLGQGVFSGCKALKKITLPSTLTDIGENAFDKSGYANTKSNWKNGVLYAGKYLIKVDEKFSGKLTIKNGTLTMATGACRACLGMTSVSFPSSMKEIREYSFYNCQGLKEVTIPDSITSIGAGAFTNCIALKEITVPKTVTSIGEMAMGFAFDYDSMSYSPISDLVICGYTDSAADEYAYNSFIAFKALDAAAPKEGIIDIKDGMASQVIRYSDPTSPYYSNKASEILRFAVYVETDYDTDRDGKPDLVKAFVQVPKAAVKGQYQAPVIFEANPYAAGMTTGYFDRGKNKVTDKDLKNTPAKRTPRGTATCEEVAEKADPADWNYTFKSDSYQLSYYNNLKSYDYFLVRGFAFVTCSGLGSKGSEGIQVCGTEMERDAFKNVVEWLHGDRVAYTDLKSDIAVKADWSNKKVGMTGLSYVGAMAYEVATTGVDGLETVVPIAGPSSFYDFSNSQGLCTNKDYKYDYTTTLSGTCASRFFEDYDTTAYNLYLDYTNYMATSQEELQGDYGDYWADRDYSAADRIRVPALIVQGLNDETVRPKQFDLMWKAFERSGMRTKAILHQNEHVNLYNADEKTDIKIGDYTFAETLNRWFSHYLLGVDNGVDKMPAITAQSNVDGKFYSYDDWKASGKLTIKPETKTASTNVTAKNASEDNETLLSDVFVGKESTNAALWKTSTESDVILQGAGEVKLRIKCDNIDSKTTAVAAVLVDTADEEFSVFNCGFDTAQTVKTGTQDYGKYLDPVDIVEWKPAKATKKIVTFGTMDLKNPSAGYMPSTAVKEKTPVKSNEWHDYTIYLQPTLYTVPKGHRLELYIVPYVNGAYMQDVADIFPAEDIATRFRCTVDGLCRHTRDYSFTIDNEKSEATLFMR